MKDARKARAILLRASSALIVLMLCSCDGTLFHSYRQVDEGWLRDSALLFTYVGDGSAVSVGGMFLETRTDASYRYKNLAVRAEYLNAGDSLLAADTVHVKVYGDDGQRKGYTAGMVYQNSSEMSVINILSGDSISIRISHIMPDDTLHGVFDVGVKLVAGN